MNNVKKTALFANVGFPKEKSSSEMLLHKERTTYMETDDGQMDYNLWSWIIRRRFDLIKLIKEIFL